MISVLAGEVREMDLLIIGPEDTLSILSAEPAGIGINLIGVTRIGNERRLWLPRSAVCRVERMFDIGGGVREPQR